MGEHRLRTFRVMLGGVNAGAARRAQHHRAGHSPPRAIAQARRVIDDLVNRRIDEAGKLNFGDGLQPHRRHAHRDPGDAAFGQGRVDHARAAEARLQAVGGAKHAAIDADVLAEKQHLVVFAHCARERKIDGLDQSDFRHRHALCVRRIDARPRVAIASSRGASRKDNRTSRRRSAAKRSDRRRLRDRPPRRTP